MIDKLLQQYKGNLPDKTIVVTATDESEQVEDLGAFGWLRGVRDRAVMLELRKKDGNILALGYHCLERVEFDPSDGITLHFASQTVKVSGRNLENEARHGVRLLQGIMWHRIPWIREADDSTMLQATKTALVVEGIKW